MYFGLERLGDSNHFIQKFDLSSIAARKKRHVFLGYAFKISVIPYGKIEAVRIRAIGIYRCFNMNMFDIGGSFLP